MPSLNTEISLIEDGEENGFLKTTSFVNPKQL